MQKNSFLVCILFCLFALEISSQSFTLNINGQTTDETKIIDSIGYLKSHKDILSMTSEIDSIQNSLLKIGYINNELKHSKKINDSTFQYLFHLNEKIKTIAIYYNKNTISPSILKLVSKNVFDAYFIIDFYKIETALSFINSEISKNGFPFSKLRLSNIKAKTPSHLQARLISESSEAKRTINDIVIKGYEKFPKSFLKHYLKIKKHQVFDLNAIKSKTGQLRNLRFASEIKPPEVLFTKDSTTLYLYLKKSRSNNFDGFLGFGSNEETNRIEFDGYLNLDLTNNLNFGESLKLLYKSDENDQNTFEVNTSLPYLFKSPIGADLLLRIFRRDSSFTTINQSAKIHYQINSNQKIYAGVASTESNNLLSETMISSISDYKTRFYTLAYEFIKPDSNNFLFPIKFSGFGETGFGERKSSFKTEAQTQINIDIQNIFYLNQKNSIYIRTNASSLMSNTYFENELLRFGGINSIRGFEENSIFASLFGVLNTEYRYQLSNSIYAHSIFDAGYFENKLLDTKEKLYGYGLGFGILTKAGLLRFIYANGKSENSVFKLSNSKVHLSLRANF